MERGACCRASFGSLNIAFGARRVRKKAPNFDCCNASTAARSTPSSPVVARPSSLEVKHGKRAVARDTALVPGREIKALSTKPGKSGTEHPRPV